MKNILILIDIQKEYITEGRPFQLKGIDESLENCRKLLKLAREDKQWEIIHIQHSNGDKAPRFNPTTEYFAFVEGFEPKEGEHHFVKNDFSCYSSDEFSNFMTSQTEYNAYIIGYNSVMCVNSTLEEARRKKHKMNVVSDATLAKAIENRSEKEMHDIMLSIFKAKGLATTTNTQELLKEKKSIYSTTIPLLPGTTDSTKSSGNQDFINSIK